MYLLIQTVLPAAMFAIGGVPPVALTAAPISLQVDDVSSVDPGTPPDPISERLLYVCVQGDASIAIVDMGRSGDADSYPTYRPWPSCPVSTSRCSRRGGRA